jgi:hypothetical protein
VAASFNIFYSVMSAIISAAVVVDINQPTPPETDGVVPEWAYEVIIIDPL